MENVPGVGTINLTTVNAMEYRGIHYALRGVIDG